MFLQRIQAIATSTTMIGVWTNLYINYKNRQERKTNEKS